MWREIVEAGLLKEDNVKEAARLLQLEQELKQREAQMKLENEGDLFASSYVVDEYTNRRKCRALSMQP